MIDLHNHLLSGIDDGPKSEQETLEMCRICSQDGIRVAVATPHALDGQYVSEPEDVIRRVGALNETVRTMGLDLKIVAGMEVRIVADLPQRLIEGRALTLDQGKYVLLELHPSAIPTGLVHLLKALVDQGFGAIIAHPEKNLVFQKRPEYLYHLMREFQPWDLLAQVTADSLCGMAGLRADRTARVLVQHGLAHVIATDAHASKGRTPQLSPAVRAATRFMGEERANEMVTQIPLAVLGEEQFPEEWNPTNPRRWWRIL